jgi:hypothetical protein
MDLALEKLYFVLMQSLHPSGLFEVFINGNPHKLHQGGLMC